MGFDLTKSGNELRVRLWGELGVASAAEIWAELSAHIDAQLCVSLDTEGVKRIDASIAQLFFLVSRSVRVMRLDTASPVWTNAWHDLGLVLPALQAAATGGSHGQERSYRR